jgi:hypothetical protein
MRIIPALITLAISLKLSDKLIGTKFYNPTSKSQLRYRRYRDQTKTRKST